MLSKPFKPPLLKRPTESRPTKDFNNVELPPKKPRVEEKEETTNRGVSSLKQPPTHSNRHTNVTRQPLKLLPNPPSPELSRPAISDAGEGYYMVLWRKFTNKKHKTWDGDGVLVVRGGYATLQDISGRDIGRLAFSDPLLPGSTLSIGGKDIEVDSVMSRADYVAGKPFSKTGKLSAAPKLAQGGPQMPTLNPGSSAVNVQKEQTSNPKLPKKSISVEPAKKVGKVNASIPPPRTGITSMFKPVVQEHTFRQQVKGDKPMPRHDPAAPNALVMKRPSFAPLGKHLVDVVVDPTLTSRLREHQRQGVSFLYECVMGLREEGREGCILADDMGLGKTLQTITLLWTLLKQNPIHGVGPVIKKALIVCPVTLINNWRKEFRKWLGSERIGVFVADGKQTRLTDFTLGKSYSIMIIGYERLRSVAEDLTKGSGIDIVIADEGQRLKTAGNKSAQAIESLNTPKRIILSGTPIQNDLSEFFFMANFVNKDLLDSYKKFLKRFETPILKSRQPNAHEDDVELGESRSEELAELTSKFILRRTAEVLSKYLPPKSEYILFCNPTRTQANIYRQVLASPMFQCAVGSSESALQLITILKKLCNSPSLLNNRAAEDDSQTSASARALLETLPQNLLRNVGPQASAKIRFLDSFLHTLRQETSEKIVLVSNYTSTLNLLQNLLTSLSLPFLRLDGSTPASKRQSLVDDFNGSPSVFAFLLSARAGGLGLNLIGASRLVLFDVDWNPAIEEQAMARIHREGQKRPCRIYRFVMKGGLEERIWQRQVVKKDLASSIMDGGVGSAGLGVSSKKGIAQFSKEELRDLFRLDENVGLKTHDLVGCHCQGRGVLEDTIPSEHESPDVEPTAADEPFYVESSDKEDFDDETSSLPDVETLFHRDSQTRPANALGSPGPRLTKRLSNQRTPSPSKSKLAMSSFITASQVSSPPTPCEADTKSFKVKAEMKGLMEYVHLDASKLVSGADRNDTNSDQDAGSEDNGKERNRMKELLGDDILADVLTAEADDNGASGVAWVFVKKSGRKKGGEREKEDDSVA